METRLADWIRNTPEGHEADAILRSCVHCGFCTATCPTYQLLGDELDGPRGRIYQIKQVLEGATPTRSTQVHLDRCLTCRACETTCPSNVHYGRLLDIGRRVVDERLTRPPGERLARALLRWSLSSRRVFGAALRVGRLCRRWLPRRLGAKVIPDGGAGRWPERKHARRVLFLSSCTQGALLPGIDRAAARVLDALDISVVVASGSGCCGAIREHLGDHLGGLEAARRNIEAWWPYVEDGVEALVMTASGCGLQVKDYGRAFALDTTLATRAARISALTMDLVEWLAPQAEVLRLIVGAASPLPIAFHAPCTLQHGQKLVGRTEGLLAALGARLVPVRDSHLCCGSAGAYSLVQPGLSGELRDRKLGALLENAPQAILSANVGCIAHLQSATTVPVRHWIEWVADRLANALPK